MPYQTAPLASNMEENKGNVMKSVRAAVLTALLLVASAACADIVLTGVTVTPNPIGVSDTVTISVSGFVKPFVAGYGKPNCTGVEIFFGDSNIPSTDPYKPASTYVRVQPGSTASFPIVVSHQYTTAIPVTIIASTVSMYNGIWYQCGSNGQLVELSVVEGQIQSIKSISPAVVNQQTSVVVKGVGSCSQNVQVEWGDGNTFTIAGPVNLKAGGVASHTYASSGTFTAKASGSVCDGVATTPIGVGLFPKPGRVIDGLDLQRLRERLDRYAQLPPPPGRDGGPPNCPICAGLAQQISALDEAGLALQAQSSAVVEDLDAARGKGKPARSPVSGELLKQLDGYFVQRAHLLKLYGLALGKTGKK